MNENRGLSPITQKPWSVPYYSLLLTQNVAGHAVVGCVTASASGGDCGARAMSAGFGSAAAPFVPNDLVTGTIVSAAIGGTASALGGGKFGNGAMTASYGYLFNHWAAKLAKLAFRGRVEPVGKGVGREDAVRLASEGEDVIASSRNTAHDIAKELGNGEPPVHDVPHSKAGPEARPHYHAAGRPEGVGHVFYSVASALTVTHLADQCGCVNPTFAEIVDFVNPLSIGKDVADIYRSTRQ